MPETFDAVGAQFGKSHAHLERLKAQLTALLESETDPNRRKKIQSKLDKINAVKITPANLMALLKIIAEIIGFITLFLGQKPVE